MAAQRRLANLQGHLEITDKRTQKEYKIEIRNDCIKADDLAQVLDKNGQSLRSYDPGYMNTFCCTSKVGYIDGDKGLLEYSGYNVESIAPRTNFMEVAFLLQYGDLPTAPQLNFFKQKVMQNSHLHTQIVNFIQCFKPEAHPMGMMASAIAALGTLHPEYNPTIQKKNVYKNPKIMNKVIHHLIGVVPTIAACVYRHRLGLPFVPPNENLSYVENFLYMLDRKGDDLNYRPHPTFVKVLEVLFVLHAEHELNCSTASMRHLASTVTDVYNCVGGAILALYGPLHGGANEAVVKQFQKIGDKSNIEQFLQDVKNKKKLLMGFGHRVYKTHDSRVETCRNLCQEIFKITGKEQMIEVATEMEKIAISDKYFKDRHLYPNIDFYSGIIYKAMGLNPEYYTVLFIVGRLVGWLAHWKEYTLDPEAKISRPRGNYIGKQSRQFVPINKRKDTITEDIDSYPDPYLKVKPTKL